MTDTFAVTVFSGCLTVTLMIAGVIASTWNAPQVMAVLFATAGCTAVSSIVTAVLVSSANAAQAKARARYAE